MHLRVLFSVPQNRARKKRLNIIIVAEGAIDTQNKPITSEQIKEVGVHPSPGTCLERGSVNAPGGRGLERRATGFFVLLDSSKHFIMTHSLSGMRITQLLTSGEPEPLEYGRELPDRQRK